LAVRGIELGYTGVYFNNAIAAQVLQGHYAAADSSVERFARTFPGDPAAQDMRTVVASAKRDYATAQRSAPQLRAAQQASAGGREVTSLELTGILMAQGRFSQSRAELRVAQAAEEERGLPANYISNAAGASLGDITLRNRPAEAIAAVTAAL